MNANYRIFKQQIRKMCKPAFVELCTRAGLTEDDRKVLVPFYFDFKSEDFLADSLGMSKSSYQQRKKLLIERIMSYRQFISKF